MEIPKLFTELRTYNRARAMGDLFAGVTVGIVALPLAMAFAIASGLPPERGLFTAIVAGFLISALGGSRHQIGGPTGAFVVLVATIVGEHGYDGLAACTLMAGVMLMAFGLAGLGGLIKFIPFPVTTGFTTGIALVIFSSQVKELLGLKMEAVPVEFVDKWWAYFEAAHTVNAPAAAVGFATVAVIVLTRWLWPKGPAMLIAMLATTAAAATLGLEVETIGSRFGELPRMLPAPGLPEISLGQLPRLVSPAFTIALLAAIESLLSATVADGMTGGRHRPNVELLAQGLANIGSVIFGGIPATGAIARTATNIKSGAQSPVAGMVHAVVLALLLLVFAPWAKLIPLATLAGILVVVCYNMSELGHFVSILRGPKSDALVLGLTFVLTVLVDLTVAVEVGVVLASLLFIRRMAGITNVGSLKKGFEPGEERADDPDSIALRQVPQGVEVFEVNGPFFFGTIDTFKNSLGQFATPPPVLIIRTRDVPVVDATAIHVLRQLHQRCKREGTLLVFSGVHTQPYTAFDSCGFMDEVGRENFLGNIDDALKRARQHLKLDEQDERDSASQRHDRAV